jgi:hypothetical protein
MRDEVFAIFIEEFGEATHHVQVPQLRIEKYRGRLPDQLLHYWAEEGWCGYAKGLLWTVDPDEYEDLVDEWLEGTPFQEVDNYHIIARTAFGTLYACGERTGSNVTIGCAIHAISAVSRELKPKDKDGLDQSIRSFFLLDPSDCDLKDQNRQTLFERALKKLGPLSPDQLYGFEPAIIAGGPMALENLHRVSLDQHLTLLRQLAPPRIPFTHIDLDQLLKAN